jgi:alkylation response protein AidB-like acyl-CoA dehydrogenase
VTGRWGFVSGCQHCDWIYGNCIEEGATGNGDVPPLRVALFRADEIEIEDTWSVSGLCGTGSHDVVANDVFVPTDRTFALLSAEPCLADPLVRMPLPSPYALQMASGALGIAQGALDDILALASDKVPLFCRGVPRHEPAVPEPTRPGGRRSSSGAVPRLRRGRGGVGHRARR